MSVADKPLPTPEEKKAIEECLSSMRDISEEMASHAVQLEKAQVALADARNRYACAEYDLRRILQVFK